jgi:hypothetical protein
MVNILRHAPAAPIMDEQAMQTFRHQWQAYLAFRRFLTDQAARFAQFLRVCTISVSCA